MNWVKRTARVLVLIGIGLTLIGCHTARGAGKDIERAGEEIQEEAEEY
ncbi:MAG: entericidin A/B family lipoprotein [Anaerohalosphaeraceae bacterium]